MTKAETIQILTEVIDLLNKNKQTHSYCEDTWYSCPKEPTEGCGNKELGTQCLCGADETNAQFDKMIEKLQKYI
jgi:hypothetical protein